MHPPAIASAEPGAPSQAPLYPRLPRGPHSLDRRVVVRNQRARIFGAMVAAVTQHGYRDTSVRELIALAGVSRRSFYEQFANKQACLLAAFDTVAARAAGRAAVAARRAGGSPGERVEAALAAVALAIADEPDAAALAARETALAGPPALAHLRRALVAAERALGALLAAGDEPPLPGPVLRAVTGGLCGLAASDLQRGRQGPGDDGAALATRLTAWALPFAAVAETEALTRALSASAAERLRAPPGNSAAPARRVAREAGDGERLRLMAGALRLAVLGDFAAVTGQELADEAGVGRRALARSFADPQACYAEALEQVDETLRAVVGEVAARDHDDWPAAVLARIEALLHALAARPLHAHTLATGVYSAGRPALERAEELLVAIVRLLTAGAPGPSAGAGAGQTGPADGGSGDPALARPAPGALERAIASALLHAIGCQVASGRPQLLVALAEPLAFAVTAPYIGAGAAVARAVATARS